MGKRVDGRAQGGLRIAALLLVAVALGWFAAHSYIRLNVETESGTLFHLLSGSWTAAAPLPGALVGSSAAFHNQVWVATEDSVLRLDGNRWTRLPEVLKTKSAATLAANSSSLWVLDRYGNLMQFDGRHWSAIALAGKLPGVNWGPRGIDRPAMAAAADGSLWILWDGLWHSSASGWNEVRPGGNEVIGARLVGADQTHAWLVRDGELQAVTPAGAIEAHLRPDAAGFPVAAVLDVIPEQTGIWVAGATGLALYDGSTWHAAGLPPGTSAILDATAATNRGLWVIGYQPLGLPARLKLALPMLSFSGATLVLLIYLAYSLFRLRQERLANAPAVSGFDPRNLLADRWTAEALYHGDYTGALQRLHRLALGLPNRHILMREGTVLAFAGHFEEAEDRCRRAVGRSLEAGGHEAVSPPALDCLATVLIDLKRFDEAHQWLDEALRKHPGFAPAQINLAELVLLESRHPEQALELIDEVLASDLSRAPKCPGRDLASEAAAIRAWALAACGKKREAEGAIRRAPDTVDQKFRPALAGVYWRTGMALEALHEHNSAVTHFHAAMKLDPDGKYGKRAQQQLQQHTMSDTV